MLSLLQILLRLLQLIKGASTVKGAYGKAAGVEVGVYGYSFGVGFEAEAVKKPEFDAFKAYKLDLVAETKAFDFEGFNVKAGAQYSVEKEAALKKQKLTVLQVLFPQVTRTKISNSTLLLIQTSYTISKLKTSMLTLQQNLYMTS